MPALITVTGCFLRHGQPVQGLVRFTPERLWVVEDGITWAALAPHAELVGGRFTVQLTPTDTDTVPWYYQIECPAGTWRFRIYRACAHYGLKELLDEHHPRAGTTD
jgi:hypothetical protein